MNGLMGMRLLAARASVAMMVLPLYAGAKCEIERYGELPVTMSEARPLITGSINGQPAMFIADSGAFFSMLSRESAQKYALRLAPPINMKVEGIGGEERVQVANVKELTLQGFVGGRAIKGVDFFVGGDTWAEGIAGVIGQNVIGYADTEYDLSHGAIRLFRSKDCRHSILAYWATAGSVVAEVSIEPRTPLESHIVGNAKLNGQWIKVVFDSGALRSMLNLKAAARAGVRPESEGVMEAGLAGGIGVRERESWVARFDTLDLGGELIRNAPLRIGDVHLPLDADMLLGADFFLANRIYIAAAQNKLYFTYNGGPVFNVQDRLVRDDDSRTTAAVTPVAGVSLPVASDALSGAAEYRRRGAAFASRDAFQAALADLDEAIRIDASDPENYYQRGLIHQQSHDAKQALADFNETLKLNENHLGALMSRGALRLATNDEAAARSDFESAEKIASRDVSLPLNIAQIYQAAGRFDEAIARLNAWIAANPRDERLGDALRNRCLMRGLSNKELGLALRDCNDAIKQQSANSVVLVNRALVYLRLGNFDKAIADFKAAAKLQPKNAWALYGLGLAELKKGLKSQGDKDLQNAVVTDSSVVQSYKRIGLAP